MINKFGIPDDEASAWERDNMDSFTGATIDYEAKPGYKVITYMMKDKSKKVFEIEFSYEVLDEHQLSWNEIYARLV